MTLNFMLKYCISSRIVQKGITTNFNLYIHKTDVRSHVAILCTRSFYHYDKILINRNKVLKDQICGIHISPPRKALPPLLLLAVRSIAKIGAIISGRFIRQWWQKLSPEERAEVMEHIHSKKSKIAFIGTLLSTGLYLYYLANLTEDPITKRKRFIVLNQKQLYELADFEYQQQMATFSAHVVPHWHPIHRRASHVVNTLLLANKHLKEVRDKVWSVTVIDKPDVTNAFALANGKIFVFTGMLNICSNDDQLAIVLAHEISHAILSHSAETMSKMFLLELILLVPTLLLFSILSDSSAIISDWIISSTAKLLFHLPFSRSIEKEADVVGLQLAAVACYDVREAPNFWGKMKVLSEDASVEWLSTHPRHSTRQIELQKLLPGALKLREANNCPPLAAKFSIF
ncbi:hypothetical protein RUM44_005399 [Polyplax serrata]|uniref:Metalloendopeptidase OMA1, mitochondrial n=1 Tax=Polyplax serrata TaxID=468196 RepID=A0ABR1ADW0_POLSC